MGQNLSMANLPSAAFSPLSPEYWPFSLELLPQPAYLVGGAVRDALLLKDREYLDLDFVMPAQAVQTASQIAEHYSAGFVLLDADRQIARVVFKDATVDFAQQEGDSLERDLNRRDYTVNAIAYNPHTGVFIDPLQGCADIEAGLMRMVAPANLKDDPLRLLRAYRQAAQLNFSIEPATRTAIRAFAPLLGYIAAERVRSELSYLLATSEGTPQLQAAWEDGLVQTWFPSATGSSLAQVAAVDESAAKLQQTWPDFGTELSRSLRDTSKTSLLAVAKLTSLLDPDFHKAEAQLLRLKYSRPEMQAALAVLNFLPDLLPAAKALSVSEQYFLFRNVGTVFPALAVFAVASGMPVDAIAPLIERFLTSNDPVAHPIPTLTGRDLMTALNLPPGPLVGRLLTAIGVARAEGKISTPEEALQLAQQLLKSEV